MDTGTYAVLFVGGAAVLALWVHFRAGRFAPQDMRGALIHLGAALVVCQLFAPAVSAVVRSLDEPVLRVVSVMGVSLPALVYALLTTIWLISLLQATLRRGMLR
jgi:hypothetical protein